MKKTTKEQLLTIGIVAALYILAELLMKTGNMSSLMQGLLVPMCTYSLTAIGLNLCVGYLGELSIGHAGFMCVGAFAGALCTKVLQGTVGNGLVLFLISLCVGIAMAALFGFLIGVPVLRLRGDYLAIVTLAFGEIIKNIINVLYIAKDGNGYHFAISDAKKLSLLEDNVWLINGAKGITKMPQLSSFTAGIILILIALVVVHNLVHSRSGRAIMAIRDNRISAGKSTTLACMVDHINKARDCHIITMEDPIEYIHRHKKAIVTQREISIDTPGYPEALRSALRESPDVILLGEMRDYETISAALTAAEAGVLVLSTLHTSSAADTIGRIIDVFPDKANARIQLALALKAVVCQQLVPSAEIENHRIPVFEVMKATDAVQNLIRENKLNQLTAVMQSGSADGMRTMDGSLLEMYQQGRISKATALKYRIHYGYEYMEKRLG